MLQGRNVVELERDYQAASERLKDLSKDAATRLRAYRRFVSKQSYKLNRYPGALLFLAHAEPMDSPVLADARQRFNDGLDRPWLRLLHPPATDQNPALRVIDVGSKVNAVAHLELDGIPYTVTFSRDGLLRLWNLDTGECVRKFQGPE